MLKVVAARAETVQSAPSTVERRAVFVFGIGSMYRIRPWAGNSERITSGVDDVHPVLELAGWRVPAWGLFNAVACVVVLVGALGVARRRDVAPGLLVNLWPCVILGGVVGGHIYFVLAGSPEPWSERPLADWFDIFRGSAVQGGFVGGGLAALVYLRVANAPVLAVLDVLAPAGALAQAITRVGCFLAGCCHGRPAPSAIGVVYGDPAALGPIGVPLHAAQLYESALLVVLAAWLLTALRRRDVPDGRVFASYLVGYGAIRFAVQLFRGDDADRLMFGPPTRSTPRSRCSSSASCS
jgi:phosphatidylglycerol:prolipoprotein diacylglycerol transferase